MKLRYLCEEHLETITTVPSSMIAYGPASRDKIKAVTRKTCKLQQQIDGEWVDIPEVMKEEV